MNPWPQWSQGQMGPGPKWANWPPMGPGPRWVNGPPNPKGPHGPGPRPRVLSGPGTLGPGRLSMKTRMAHPRKYGS